MRGCYAGVCQVSLNWLFILYSVFRLQLGFWYAADSNTDTFIHTKTMLGAIAASAKIKSNKKYKYKETIFILKYLWWQLSLHDANVPEIKTIFLMKCSYYCLRKSPVHRYGTGIPRLVLRLICFTKYYIASKKIVYIFNNISLVCPPKKWKIKRKHNTKRAVYCVIFVFIMIIQRW